MARPENFDIQVLIESLQGTCMTLQEGIEHIGHEDMDEYDLTPDDTVVLDNEIFLCSECSWWCEVCEMSEIEQDICEDCLDEEQ